MAFPNRLSANPRLVLPNTPAAIEPPNEEPEPSYLIKGSTVIGIKFDEGVMIAADNLLSLQTVKLYHQVQRVYQISDNIIIGMSGDYADFQNLISYIEMLAKDEARCGMPLSPDSLLTHLTRHFYCYADGQSTRKLWLNIIVGGMEQAADGGMLPFLGYVDERGMSYKDDVLASGIANSLVKPMAHDKIADLKKRKRQAAHAEIATLPEQQRQEALQKLETITRKEASAILHDCMELLFYRDCNSVPDYTVAICQRTTAGVRSIVVDSCKVDQKWYEASMPNWSVGQSVNEH